MYLSNIPVLFENKEDIYKDGVVYRNKLVAGMTSSEPPFYRYNEMTPDDIRLLGYLHFFRFFRTFSSRFSRDFSRSLSRFS